VQRSFRKSFLAAEVSRSKPFSARHLVEKRAAFMLMSIAQVDQRTNSPGEGIPSDLPALNIEQPVQADVIAASVKEENQPADREMVSVESDPPAIDLEALRLAAMEEGRAEERAAVNAMLQSALAALAAAGNALAQASAGHEEKLVVPLARSALKLAEQLARQVLMQPDSLQRYLQAVIDAAEPVRTKQDAVILLNPHDMEILRRVPMDHAGLVLQSDASVQPGGAVLQTATGVIDDRIELRLRELGELVLAAAGESLKPAPADVR
jgi:flagellar biosynthesis/type III secretory pathway protein FliH